MASNASGMSNTNEQDPLRAQVNGWLVEVAFGVYDREDLPKLANQLMRVIEADRLDTRREECEKIPHQNTCAIWNQQDFCNCYKSKRIAELESQRDRLSKETKDNE